MINMDFKFIKILLVSIIFTMTFCTGHEIEYFTFDSNDKCYDNINE
jgi:hypothetical protein